MDQKLFSQFSLRNHNLINVKKLIIYLKNTIFHAMNANISCQYFMPSMLNLDIFKKVSKANKNKSFILQRDKTHF